MIKYYNVAEEVAKSHLAERERSVRVLIWLREVSPLGNSERTVVGSSPSALDLLDSDVYSR